MRRLARPLASAALLLGVAALASPVRAWDASGHRLITWLALDGLSADAPAFLREAAPRESIGWQAGEPDRWRAVRLTQLTHENAPDHYLDVDKLGTFGLTLSTLPPLRYRYVRDLSLARAARAAPAGEGPEPYNEKRDASGQNEFPGFVPYAIMQEYGQLVASFKTYRILDKLADPARQAQLDMERANIMSTMGVMAHFVGDTAQPLHSTKHHHGWVGDNPKGYSTSNGIHSYIDGQVLTLHRLTYGALKGGQAFATRVDPADPWKDVLAHLQRSFDQVVPLYEMDKSGALKQDAGKAFITARLRDGADMLAAMYNAAWAASAVTDQDVQDFVRYDSWKSDDLPGPAAPRP